MSLWQVDSGLTREMMIAYYDKLEKGAGRSEAMRQVQLEMLGQNDRVHPNLWASFIVSGNPAALDGMTAVRDLGKLAPGMHGCACEAKQSAGSSHGMDTWWVAALAMLAAAGRTCTRARHRTRAAAGA
jgi:hypothetical protein